MAKIGTAHIEIKPMLNEEALEALVQRIEEAVAAGVERALKAQGRPLFGNVELTYRADSQEPASDAALRARLSGRRDAL